MRVFAILLNPVYLPYLMCGYSVALGLLLLGCWLTFRAIPGLRGIGELAWAIFFAMVAVLLIGLRPVAPAWLTTLVGNYALMASFLLVYWATTRVLRQRAGFLPWGAGLCLAVLPAFCYATWVHPDIVLRIWLSGATWTVISGAAALLLFRHRSAGLGFSARAVGGVQICNCVADAARCVLSTIYPPADFVHGDWVQTGFTYAQFLLGIGNLSGVVWLSFCQHRAELEQMALTDSLTGLLNRRAFDEVLSREMTRAGFGGELLGLIMLDLDHFKELNDTHGHGAGDEALRAVSHVLKQTTRPGDTLARYGGEEFAFLARKTDLVETQAVAERLREAIERCAAVPEWRLTASVGIAMSDGEESVAGFIGRCDRALYASKRAGRNVVTVCSPSGLTLASRRPAGC